MKTELKLTRWILATVFILLTGLAVLFGCTPETVEEKRVVTFMNGGDVFDVQEVDLGEKYEFPAERPTREQPDDEHICEFVGWTLDPNYYEYRSEILTEADYVVGDLTIYAAYRTVAIAETPDGGADLEYSVEFRMPRGDDFGSYSGKTLSKQTVKRYGSAALPSAGDMPVIKGYHFTGAWEGGTLTDVRGNRRVTAVYEKNTYTYSWHYLDEQSSREVAFREAIDLGEKPEVESAFVFDGWFMDEARTIPATLTEAPAEDIDLYAKYHVDFSTASVSHEGNMVYGDDMNKLYVSGLSYADGLDYTFVWTVNNERGDLTEISNYPVKNAGIYNVSVHIYADYHNGVLKDEGDARNENSSTALVFMLEKATLSATVTLNTHSVVYGEEPPAASIEYSGFEFGETAEEVGVGEDFLFMQGDVNVMGNLHAGAYSVKTVPHELQNYKFAEIAAPSFTVEKKNLTVTMSVDNYTYGAGFAPEISFSNDFVYGEGEDVLGEHWFVLNGSSPATKRAGSADSGKYTEGDILHAGDHVVELKGFESGDYQVHLPGEEQFSVAKRKASATLSAVGGVYGVTPQVSFTLNNVLEQDEARFSADYTYKRGGNGYSDVARFIVGSYTVEAAFHEDGSDYEPLPGASATFNITKAELHVGVAVENKYTYGDQIDPAVTFTRSDFRFNENENTKGLLYGSAQFVYRKATAPDEEYRGSFAVDSYTVEATGYNSDNYEIIYTQSSFDITKKDLTLTVRLDNDSILYGSRPQYSRDSGVLDGILYDGFISGESAQSVFAGALPAVHYYKNSADGDEISINEVFHAGSYVATTTAEAHNYDITVVPESFTVTQRTLYVGIKLTAAALEYGKKPHAGIVYEKEGYDGFYGTEQTKYVSSAAIFYDGATDYYQSVLDSSSTKMVAGKYSLSVTGISEDIGLDYAVTYQHVVEHVGFEITPKALTAVIGKDKTDYTYGDKPVLTLSFEGWAYSENESDLFDDDGSHIVINSSAYNAPVILDAGDYTATLAGSLNTNYKIEVTEATFTVNKKALTVKASVEDLIYGNDPVPHISYTGFIDGEDQNNDLQGKLEYSYSGELSSSNHYRAGSHTLTLSGYSSDNYEIKYEGATFNVSPVEITLTTQEGWSVYADDRESAADGYWYAVSGDIIDGELTFSLSVTRDGYEYTHGSDKYYPAGNYKVSVSFNVNGDYAVKHNGVSVADGKVENDFTVAKKNVMINLRGESKWANRSSWSFTPTGVVDPKFTFTGVIVLNDPENTSAQSYSETEINKTFKWREEPVIRLADSDSVVTDNFDFVYTLNLTLGESDFSISKPEGESAQFTYDKQPHAFSVTATADGVDDGDITIEYKTEQSAEYAASVPEFTNAGSYTVWFRVSAPNCTDKEDSFIVTGNREKLAIPTAGNNKFTYNTQLQTYTPASYNEETMNISGNTFTDVPAGGSQTATVSIEDKTNYEWTDSTQNDLSFPFTVDKATVEAPEIAHKTYNKDTQTATVAESELYNVTANDGGVAAGEYDVILTLTAPNNYKWSSGAEEAELKLTFVIDKAQLVRPTAGKNTFTYTGAEQTYTPDSYDEETMTIAGNTFTNVPENGSQTATVSIADKTNYEWTDGRQDEITFAITVAKAEYSVTAGDQTYTYNSKEQGAEISVSGVEGEQNFSQPEITYSYGEQSSTSALKFMDADRYTINYSVGETTNYKQRSGSYTIIINKAEPVLLESSASGTYSPDGGLLTEEAVREAVIKSGVYGDAVVTFEITDGRGQHVEGFAQIVNAGTYTVKVSVSGKNYQVVEAKTYTFTIEQKKVTVTVEKQGDFTYDSESHSLVNAITVSDGSSLNAIGTPAFTLNGSSKPREELVATNAGEYKVNISVTTNGNYAITVDGGEFTVTVSKATLTVTLPTELTYTYNGEDHFQSVEIGKAQGEDKISVQYSKNGQNESWGERWEIINVNSDKTIHYNISAVSASLDNYALKSASGEVVPAIGEYTLTIKQATLETLPQDVAAPTVNSPVVRRNSQNLDKVCKLGDNWKWAERTDTTSALTKESYTVTAIYTDPSGNYLPYEQEITFTTRKEKITVALKEDAAFVTGYGTEYNNGNTLGQFTLSGEDRTIDSGVSDYSKFSAVLSGLKAGYQNLGTTYLGNVTISVADNEYFELSGQSGFEVIVKVTSVELDGALYTIEDALNTAQSGQTITVKNNTSFAEKDVAKVAGYYSGETPVEGYYTIKAGVTLFLPYDISQDTARGVGTDGAKNNHPGFDGTTHKAENATPDAPIYTHSSLGDTNLCDLSVAVPDGIKLINSGTLNIGGITTGSNGGAHPAGQTCSGYAQLTLGAGSVIVSTGDIVSRGFILEENSNNGSKLILNKGTLNIPFVVVEHRGGTKFSNIYDNMIGSPFNRFYLQNVTCLYEVHDGASVLGHANMYASSSDNSTDVKFIGGASHFIQLQSGSYMTAKYDTTTQVTKWDVFGPSKVNALSLSISIATLSTEGIMFPVSWYHNFAFHAINAVPAEVDATMQDMKILPGGAIEVDKNVTLKVNKLFVYDKDFKDPAKSTDAVAAPMYESNKGEGRLVVNGRLEAAELGGFVQTTADGATLKVTTARLASYELINADNLAWKSEVKEVTGKIWNNSGTVSANAQTIKSGEFTSKNGGWITDDSQFALEFEYGYQNSDGSDLSTHEGTPQANNPSYFVKSGMQLQPASLDGYEFVGWYSDDKFGTAITEIDDKAYISHMDGSAMKIYGLFKKLPPEVQNYTIEFIANSEGATIGGQSSIKVNVRSDSLTEFDLQKFVPELANHEFKGWFKEAGCTTQVTNLNAEYFAENNLKLFAKFEIKKYNLTVTLNCDSDTTGTIDIKVNDALVKTINTEKTEIITVPFGAKVQITVTPGKDCAIESIVTVPEGYVAGNDNLFNMPAQNVSVKVHIEEDGGLCLVEGSLILMADGTTKKIEDLQSGDLVIVFNHETGKYEIAPVLYNVHAGDSAELATVARLKFSDGTEIGVAYQHFFFDLDLQRYVLITVENAHEFIGHKFAKVGGEIGDYKTVGVTLCDVTVSDECVRYYSPVSVYHSNIIANGLLTHTTWPIYGNPEGLMNYFEFDSDMKYNEDAMQSDIEKYGLYTYEDFIGVLSEEAFYAGPWKYFKVAVGKGQLTWEDILNVIDWLYNSGELDPL